MKKIEKMKIGEFINCVINEPTVNSEAAIGVVSAIGTALVAKTVHDVACGELSEKDKATIEELTASTQNFMKYANQSVKNDKVIGEKLCEGADTSKAYIKSGKNLLNMMQELESVTIKTSNIAKENVDIINDDIFMKNNIYTGITMIESGSMPLYRDAISKSEGSKVMCKIVNKMDIMTDNIQESFNTFAIQE